MKNEKISYIIESNYTIKSLKPQEKVNQNMKRDSKIRQPLVDLLIADNGKKYKYHQVQNPNNIHFTRIREMIPIYNQLDFVPKIIYNDSTSIILDYIDGEFPILTSDDFTFHYAKNLATLHNTEVIYVDLQSYLADLFEDIDYLKNKRYISKRENELIKKLIMSFTNIDKIKKSMIYADLTKQNFILTKDQKLYFIDLGSFQNKIICDHFLLSSVLYSSLNQKLFKETYLSNGGDQYFINSEHFITFTSYVTRTVQQIKSLTQIEFRDFRKRRARKQNIKTQIKFIKTKLD